MRVLTNDPSITAWGWAVVEFKNAIPSVLDSGCIKTSSEATKRRIRKSDDRVRRFEIISRELQNIHKEYNLAWVLSELPHGSQSASAAVMIGATAGILTAFGVCNELPIEWFSEGDAKKHLLGKRNAAKLEIINAIKNVYGESWYTDTKYIDEAVADALAIFHAGKDLSPALKHSYNLSRTK
jgi:Holliday junction resolvasome RuvABC endonuclease subunit